MSQTKAQLISDLVQALNFTGTANAPANGLFLSATNTLQLSTASTPRLTINSDGHVDVIGNLDVGAGLDVTGDITATGDLTVTGGDVIIQGTEAKLHLTDTNNDDDFLVFNNNGTFKVYDATNNADRLQINSSGVVTIGGNTNFDNGIDVTGATTLGGNVAVTGTTDGVLNLDTSDSRGAFVRFGQGGSFHNMVGCADGLITSLDKEDLGIRATDRIGFATNGDNLKMTILSSGNVGIGTISPSTIFHIKTFNPDVYLENTGTGTGQLRVGHFTNGAFIGTYNDDGGSSDNLRLGTHSGDTRIQILSGGNVGIGTSSPSTKLHVNGDITAADSIVSANLPGRNFLINGAMQINQRVGSPNLGYFNPVTSSIYTLDRWKVVIGSSFDTDSAHITRSSTSPAGFGASMRWEIGNTETPSANQNAGIEQKIEAQNLQGLAYGTSSAKTMTLSFHVRSNKTGTYCVQIMQEDGSKYQMHEYTISSSNTWEKKTITIVGNTSNAINNDDGVGLRIIWMLTVGSGDHVAASSTWVSGGDLAATSNQVNLWDNGSNEWYLTGCQLEVGTIATEFEHIEFGKELRSCQRYFFNVKGNNNHRTGIPGYANSTTELRAMVNFPTAMRTSPSFNGSATAMVFDAQDDSASFNCNTLSQAGTLTNTSPHMMMLETSTSGMTNGQAGTLEFRADNGFLEFSAEL